MKLYKRIATLMVSIFLCLSLVSCEKNDTNPEGINGNSNNNGPIINNDDSGIEINMHNNGDGHIRFSQNYYIYINGIEIRQCGIIVKISTSNNFYFEYDGANLWRPNHGDYYGSIGEISSVGITGGLSKITYIPTGGWCNQIAVKPGEGYVVRYRGGGFNYTYARIYVKNWIVDTYGGIIGATIIYQENWRKDQASCLTGSTWQCLQSDRDLTIDIPSCSTLFLNNVGITDTLLYVIEERHGRCVENNDVFFVDNFNELYYYVHDIGVLSFSRSN